MDIRDYLRLFRRRWLLIVASVLVVTAAAASYTFAVTPQYTSTARLFVSTQQNRDSNDIYQGGLFSAQRVTSYADFATGRELAATVLRKLNLDVSPAELSSKVRAEVVPDTVNLNLSVTDPDPQRAQALTQTYAEGLVDMVRQLETPPGTQQAPIKVTIVDAASRPTEPSSPSTARNIGLGVVLGALIGLALTVVRETLDNTVKTSEDVEATTDVPVLGTIAYDTSARQQPLTTALDGHAPRVEAFRVLRTNMQFVEVDQSNKVFVVTSAVPEEGKTSTSANLALAMAQAGNRTLLLEADLRRPKVQSMFDLDQSIGVTTVLLGRVSIADAVQKHGDSGLEVLASGAVPPNPSELLQSNAMRTLLGDLRAEYDVVIVDAPPLLPVTDAALLASQVDGALLVVRYGRTTKDQLTQAVSRLSQVDVRPVGVVMNMIPSKRLGGYGYGYGYGPDRVE